VTATLIHEHEVKMQSGRPMLETNNTLSISVMSGKGGVGKTNIALNLAYALFHHGSPTLLMDCDLGLANLDVLLGVAPERNLEDLLQEGVEAGDVLVPLEAEGFDFLPAASGVPELVEWDNDLQTVLFHKLNECFTPYHYLLLDLGAGINSTVLTLASMTKLQCVVITPEPTSLTDGYALIKVLFTKKKLKNFFILVNRVASSQEGEEAFSRLEAACERFLGIKLSLLGIIHEDSALTQAVLKQIPLFKFAPESTANGNIEAIASRIQKFRQRIKSSLTDALDVDSFLSDDS